MFWFVVILMSALFLGGAASSIYGFVLFCVEGMPNPSIMSEMTMFFGLIGMVVGLTVLIAMTPGGDEPVPFMVSVMCVVKAVIDIVAAIYANNGTPIFSVWILALGVIGAPMSAFWFIIVRHKLL